LIQLLASNVILILDTHRVKYHNTFWIKLTELDAVNLSLEKPALFLKGCPRCGGDLSLTRDIHGRYISCLQCGLLKDIEDKVAPGRPVFPVVKREVPMQPARRLAA
jgi:hypothetical protein